MIKNHEFNQQKQFEIHVMSSELCLTNPFHHDRGRFVFAVSPRRGEEGALGRRLRRGQQFYSDVINALRARTKNLISC
jgi:hypothetical protein